MRDKKTPQGSSVRGVKKSFFYLSKEGALKARCL